MENFFDSLHCTNRVACTRCRGQESFREWIVAHFSEPTTVPFDCPHGITLDNIPAPILSHNPEPPRPMPAVADMLADLRKSIETVPNEKKRAILVQETDTMERHLEWNSTKGDCWKRRQILRVSEWVKNAKDLQLAQAR